MEGKVSQLAETLLKEGVEQGEAEKKKIIDAAKAEAQSIIADAKKEAASIVENGKKEAADLKKSVESELKLSGDQAISALKQQIVNLIITDTVDVPSAEALSDPKVMAEYITTALKNWNGDATSVELLLPADKKESLEASLTKAVKGVLKGGVTLTFSKSVKGGFQIAPEGSTYKITLTEEDFSNFFKEYLRPRVRNILFGE